MNKNGPMETDTDIARGEARWVELVEAINEARGRYYDLDEPTISDADYDALYMELEELEARFPELATPDSPTASVGGSPSGAFAPVAHARQMTSLEDVFSFEELGAWFNPVAFAGKPPLPPGCTVRPVSRFARASYVEMNT